MTTIRFNTDTFKFTHDHNPGGRGCWAFEARGFEFMSKSMLYSEAKRWVTKEVKSMFPNEAVVEVKVLP